jgi:hypothetical protein
MSPTTLLRLLRPQASAAVSFKFTWLLVALRPITVTVVQSLSSFNLPRPRSLSFYHPCLCLGPLSLCHCRYCHPCGIIPLVILLPSLTFLPSRPVSPLFINHHPCFRLVTATLDVSNRPHRPYHGPSSTTTSPPLPFIHLFLPPPIFFFPSFPSPLIWWEVTVMCCDDAVMRVRRESDSRPMP